MPKKLHLAAYWLLSAMLVFNVACPVFGAGTKTLYGHVPAVAQHLTALGRLSPTNELHLAIGVPLRDPAGLDQFLADVYDPASPNYRQFLTPDELAARFGPSEADYAAVEQFALTNGFKITGRHGSRLLLDVSGNTPTVEQAFHFHLLKYQHPTEAREFYAPDAEPTVDAALPVADIQGLSDYAKPHPRLRKKTRAVFKSGSSPDGQGNYFGNDFRNAYVPGTTLTGAGQMVGLFQADGYYTNDIMAYAAAAGNGRTNIVIQKVLIDSFNGNPTTGDNSGNDEVSLDIELAMAMAPGLSKIMVFEGNPNDYLPNDILSTMEASNTVKNLSCSWGWPGGPSTTTDNIFKLMAAAGQSFFNASGDADAFTVGASSANGVDNTTLQNAPSSSPYITQVGGTTLTMSGSGSSYLGEAVWNWGGGTGSSGGVSSYYTIPSWQTNLSMTANGGSTSYRNIPDVALTADDVYEVYGGSEQGSDGVGGTSCAAPLWAGFMALVNQQATSSGNPPAGFINPAIYAIGRGANTNYSYSSCFHDTTSGNNYWSSSPSEYSAVSGYDLCTGWGTPAGSSLINALAITAGGLGVQPLSGFAAVGAKGGPFSPASGNYVLTNSSASELKWSLVVQSNWLSVAFTNGPLAVDTATNLLVSLTTNANNLIPGLYTANITFSNKTAHLVQNLPFTLQVNQPLSVSPLKGFTGAGPVGGPFTPDTQTFVLTNISGSSLKWSLIKTSAWLTVTSTNGTLAVGGQTNVTISLAAPANSLAAAIYTTSVSFTNPSGLVAIVPFTLLVGQPVVLNGGFETGNLTDWILNGDNSLNSVVSSTGFVHTGSYGMELGQSGSLAYFYQNLTTEPGQSYLLSLWLDNPSNSEGATPNQFLVQWNGTTLYNQVNLPFMSWSNLQFIVTASSASTVLQFGAEDTPYFLGLDDISVTPVANPVFKSSVKSGSSFKLNFGATTGLNYQVQYSTNLASTAWLNLGSAITAATNSITVTDTNTASSKQRFYRLLVTP